MTFSKGVVLTAAALFMVALLLCGGLIFYQLRVGHKSERSGLEYARRIANGPILKEWSVDGFYREAASDYGGGLDKTSARQSIQASFTALNRKYGKLISPQSRGGAYACPYKIVGNKGSVTVALINFNCNFAKGEATVLFELESRGNGWKILNFNVLAADQGPAIER